MRNFSFNLFFIIGLILAISHHSISQHQTITTRDGWVVISGLTSSTLEDVNFWENGIGAAIGTGVVLRTGDGGNTWSVILAEPIQDGISFSFPDQDTAYVLGENFYVKKTIDGGYNWFNLPYIKDDRALYWTELFMTDATHGMRIGFFISPGGILSGAAQKMEDGITWNFCCDQLDGMLNKIRFQDELRGFISDIFDNHHTWLTNNGAVSFWKPNTDTLQTIQDIFFVSQFNGYMIMSNYISKQAFRAVLKTTDQGLNWSTVYLDTTGLDNPVFRRIWFQDEMNGYIVGDNGLVTRTRDGGFTWNTEESGTTYDFVDCYFLDTNNAILVGQNGIIARKGNISVNTGDGQSFLQTLELNPNPCSDKAILNFKLKDTYRIRIQLKDLSGATILEISDREFFPEENHVYINTSKLASGLYIVHLSGERFLETAKLIVLH